MAYAAHVRSAITTLYAFPSPFSRKMAKSANQPKRILIVFDLNGCLVGRLSQAEQKAVRSLGIPVPASLGTVCHKSLHLRPHAMEMLKLLFSNSQKASKADDDGLLDEFSKLNINLPQTKQPATQSTPGPVAIDIALWTSAKKENAEKMFNLAFDNDIPPKFKFVWGRSKCTPLFPEKDLRGATQNFGEPAPWATVKDLNEIWKAFPSLYGPTNTIVIDDSPIKSQLNPANVLLVPTWPLHEMFLIDAMKKLNIRDLPVPNRNSNRYPQTNRRPSSGNDQHRQPRMASADSLRSAAQPGTKLGLPKTQMIKKDEPKTCKAAVSATNVDIELPPSPLEDTALLDLSAYLRLLKRAAPDDVREWMLKHPFAVAPRVQNATSSNLVFVPVDVNPDWAFNAPTNHLQSMKEYFENCVPGFDISAVDRAYANIKTSAN